MVKLKNTIIGLSTILILLISLGAVSAAYTFTDLNVVASTLDDQTNMRDEFTVAHGGQVSGSFTLINNDGTNDIDVTSISLSSLTDGSHPFAPSVTFSPNPSSGSPSTMLAGGGTLDVTYSFTVPQNQWAGTYTGTFTATGTDGSNTETVTFDIQVIISSDSTIVITESTVSESTTLGSSSQPIPFTVDNTGNLAQTLSFTYSDFDLNWKGTESLVTPTISPSCTAGVLSPIDPGDTAVCSIILNTDTVEDTYGIYEGTITMSATNTLGTATDTVRLQLTTERTTDDGVLRIDQGSLEDITGEDDVWRPGDIISVEDLELTNNADFVLEDVSFKITLYDASNGKKQADEEFKFKDIGDSDTIDDTYEIQIPYDAKEGEHILHLYAVGENEDDSSEKHSNLVFSDIIDVERDTRHAVVEEIELASTKACAEEAVVTVKVTNIGSRDLDDGDALKLRVLVDELDFEETQSILELNEDDSETVTIKIPIPADTQEDDYFFIAELSYDDDEDDEGLEKTFSFTAGGCSEEDIESIFGGSISFTGGTPVTGNVGQAGRYTLNLENQGTSIADFDIEVIGTSSWATFAVEPSGTLRVGPGQSTTLFVYLTPHLDATGTNTATVNVKSAGTTVGSQTLTHTVAGSSPTVTTFGSATIADINSSDALLVGSVAVNFLILIGGIAYVYSSRNGISLRNGKPRKKRLNGNAKKVAEMKALRSQLAEQMKELKKESKAKSKNGRRKKRTSSRRN